MKKVSYIICNGNDTYILDAVVSLTDNPLYYEIINSPCKFDGFSVDRYGFFFAEIEGDYHLIKTTEINAIETDDGNETIHVTTKNSEYYFKKVPNADAIAYKNGKETLENEM